MTEVLASRSGYSSRRSPAAMAAALAINGGVIALIVAVPMTIETIYADPPLRIREVPIDHAPPPEKEQPKADPKVEARAERRPLDRQPDVTAIDSTINLGSTGPEIAMGDFPLPDPFAGGGTARTDPPPPPVLVKARPDPRYAAAFRPDYPPAMRRDGREGSATVRVTIDERGRVIAVELVEATAPAFFEETRRQALESWRFVPATRDGAAIRSEQVMTVHFRLEE